MCGGGDGIWGFIFEGFEVGGVVVFCGWLDGWLIDCVLDFGFEIEIEIG